MKGKDKDEDQETKGGEGGGGRGRGGRGGVKTLMRKTRPREDGQLNFKNSSMVKNKEN